MSDIPGLPGAEAMLARANELAEVCGNEALADEISAQLSEYMEPALYNLTAILTALIKDITTLSQVTFTTSYLIVLAVKSAYVAGRDDERFRELTNHDTPTDPT